MENRDFKKGKDEVVVETTRLSTANAFHDSILNEDVLEDALLHRRDSEAIEEQTDDELISESIQENMKLPWYIRPSMNMICGIVFLFTFDSGITISSEMQLLIEAICSSLNQNATPGTHVSCSDQLVQKKSAELQKWITLTTGIVMILISTKLGKLSDIYGRKPLILFNLGMSVLSKLFKMVLLSPSVVTFNPHLFVASSVVASLGGSAYVTLALANSYLIDVVDKTKRTQSMAVLIAFFYVGLGLGPVFGTVLRLDAFRTFTLGAVTLIFTFVLALLLLPESRSHKLRIKSRRLSTLSARSSNSPSGHFLDMLQSLQLLWITEYDNEGRLDYTARRNVLLLIFIDIMLVASTGGLMTVVILYATFKFSWDNSALGTFISLAMLLKSAALLLFNPWFNGKISSLYDKKFNRLDNIDTISIYLCTFMELVGALVMTLANKSPIFMLSTVFTAFGSLGTPVLHSAILKYNTNPDKNGEFFGCLALIRNIVSLLTPVLSLSFYSATLQFDPRLTFYVMLVLLGVANLAAFLLKTGSAERSGF